MKPDNSLILTVNAGSSSIKFAVFDARAPMRHKLRGAISRIGFPDARLEVAGPAAGSNVSRSVKATDYTLAAELLMQWVEANVDRAALSVVGHRLVHGGPNYSEPQLITPTLVEELRRLSPFDPEHLPREIRLVESFSRRFPDLVQVACFDTAFHRDLPAVARLLPIPRRYEAQGIRRYGFHGLSYSYLMQALADLPETGAAGGRIILAHLGNGASLAAVRDGRPVDTSMSFTPAGGLPMSTRSGDLDPGLFAYLASTQGLDADDFNQMVNLESGLLGISETSSDIRDLLACEGQDARAAEAIALFCYQVRKWVGGFAAALGGLDTLVFSGGIGENAPVIRERICAELGFLGIELDPDRNGRGAGLISPDASRVKVRVIPTDEALTIARAVAHFVNPG
jgi:acetate kinase